MDKKDLAKIIALLLFVTGLVTTSLIFVGSSFYSLSDTTSGYLKDIAIMCFVLCVCGKPANLLSQGFKSQKDSKHV